VKIKNASEFKALSADGMNPTIIRQLTAAVNDAESRGKSVTSSKKNSSKKPKATLKYCHHPPIDPSVSLYRIAARQFGVFCLGSENVQEMILPGTTQNDEPMLRSLTGRLPSKWTDGSITANTKMVSKRIAERTNTS